MMVDTENLISVAEIAYLVGVKPVTVGRWLDRHKDFPMPVRVFSGRFEVFRRSDVEAWLRLHNKTIVNVP